MSLIMAHRGARNIWPENSRLGFENVLKAGFEAVEFDLHLTDDGEIVVIHDATLERTTDGTGPVCALTPQSRQKLRLKGEDGQFIADGVPSFDEVLDIFDGYPQARLYIELKSDHAGRPYPGLVTKVAVILRKRGLTARACLHSFDLEVVKVIRAVVPECERMISVNADWAARQGGLATFLATVREWVDVVGIHHSLCEAEYDLVLRELGLDRLSVWTLNDPEQMRLWAARGPRWLVSDDPILLRDILEKRPSPYEAAV